MTMPEFEKPDVLVSVYEVVETGGHRIEVNAFWIKEGIHRLFTEDKIQKAYEAGRASMMAEFEQVGHGLFDTDGKCHHIGQHKSSMSIGRKAFKSQPLYRLKGDK